ncbi:MAG: beta-ketoacyl-ACP synthase 3, partial [Lachnospiraceae bacterium]
MTIKIIGTGRYTPERIISNDDLSEIVDTSDEWIKSRTGIRERRIAVTESTVSMAVSAAKNAIADARIDEKELDLIIVATSTPDEIFPNTACRVQSHLENIHAMCFDLNAACSGFLYALATAHAYIQAGMIQTALLIGSECISKIIDWKDRSTCVLFGDGAGAVVVTASEEGMFHCICNPDGTKADVITCDAGRFENFITKKEWNPYMY